MTTLTEEQKAEIRARAEDASTLPYPSCVNISPDEIFSILDALADAEKRADEATAAIGGGLALNIESLMKENDSLRAEVARLRDAAMGATVVTNTAAAEIRDLREEVERLRSELSFALVEIREAADKLWVGSCNFPVERGNRAQRQDKDALAGSYKRASKAADRLAAITKKEQSDGQG